MQDTLKETSGINVKNRIESYADKHTIRLSIERFTEDMVNIKK